MTVTRPPEIPLLALPWLTRLEAAAIARVNVDKVGAAVRSGDLIEYRGAGDRCGRIKRADLDAWIESESSVKRRSS